jgi:hypothetical protein
MFLPAGRGSQDRRVRQPLSKGGVRALGDGLRLQGRPPAPGRRLAHVKGPRVQEPCHLRGATFVAKKKTFFFLSRVRVNCHGVHD